MAQVSSSNPDSLPGIVTDQPEIFEYEPPPSDDTGVSDLDLINQPTDEAISIIDIPMKEAFSFFSKNEQQIFKKFYVKNHGEFEIGPSKPEDETDDERYNRLVVEVNDLLNKFQTDKATRSELVASCSLPSKELTNNLEVLSQQLKALEFAAQDGSINLTQAGFIETKNKLQKLKLSENDTDDDQNVNNIRSSINSEMANDIKMKALEKRINMLENILGYNEEKEQNLLKTTKCDSLIDAADTLSSWLSLFKSDSIQRVNREISYLTQRLEAVETEQTAEENKLDPQAKSKLDQLYSLVTASDKHRAIVPTIIHRLTAMEELQQKAAQVVTTVNYIEQVQEQIVDNLQWNKDELIRLNEMFSTNLEHIKAVSNDIDKRIAAVRKKNDDSN